ncbi:MAG: hypothetical protein KME31_38670 [Tolypothrix carrinoi HA7290-LM1]|nr:hypothetical protein [Tolypothrix carrinoi HA7290-LM1]
MLYVDSDYLITLLAAKAVSKSQYHQKSAFSGFIKRNLLRWYKLNRQAIA